VEERSVSLFTWNVTAKLSNGIGISIVDQSPQELLYVCFEDIILEQFNDGNKEIGSVSIGRIVANNQLWVTPYPVMLRMGSRSARRRKRRHCAASLSWRRYGGTTGDMKFFECVELHTEPAIVSVDGNLVTFLLQMLQHAKDVGAFGGGKKFQARNRDSALRRALDVSEPVSVEDELVDPKSLVVDDLYTAVDYMATSAIASKLRFRYRPPDQAARVSTKRIPNDLSQRDLLSQRGHKVYIERLRISSTAAEISWSGALPIASKLPRLLRPALTFEGLPVLLRPFSQSHIYGTNDDIHQSLKSHYVSIWRIFDLLVGVVSNPTFLVRACIFTWREIFSTAFDTVSASLGASESTLLKITSALDSNVSRSVPAAVGRTIIRPVIYFQASAMHSLAKLASAGSDLLQYSAARHRASGGLVRSRNPRLFANVDGQDQLVEYVEGENAGRALLSRVRMGAHLSEGYVGHIEGAHLTKSRPRDQATVRYPTACIVMVTFERVIILNGQLNDFFCDVIWEVPFSDLVYVESREVVDLSAFTQVFLWFLQDHRSTSREERQAKAIVTDSGGLEALQCKQLFVLKAVVPQLLSKIQLVDWHLVDSDLTL